MVSSEAPTSSGRGAASGLECWIDGVRLFVPLERLERLAEYSVSPAVPLSEAWVGGVGVLEQDLFVSLALSGRPARSGEQTKGLLVRGGSGLKRFALEVDGVGGVRTLEPRSGAWRRPAGWPCPETWIVAAGDGESEALWCDTARVARHLRGARGGEHER